jgi:hypothetical protein
MRLRTTACLTLAATAVCGAVASPAFAGKAKATTSTVTSSTTVAAPTGTAMDQKARPLLDRPTLVNPTTVTISPLVPVAVLDPKRDYVVKVADAVFDREVAISGGHNVVLENATIRYGAPLGAPVDWMVRALFLKGQTGVMYVNGLQLRGPLHDGIQLDQKAPGVAVVLRNVSVDPVHGTYDGYHADLLQTWAGPSRLVVDGFTGTSDYQGFFLKPNQLWLDGPKPEYFWFNNVRLDVSHGYYALWTDGFGAFPVQTTDVAVKPYTASRNAWLWPKPSTGDTTWSNVTVY